MRREPQSEIDQMQVSVIIPVYKAEEFLAEAVQSALEQPETGEVILVEDGSPDGSLAICQSLTRADERVRLLRHPDGVNRGAGATRNLGIREARFPFVAFLDADDLYLHGRFREALRVLGEHPEADGVYGATVVSATTDEMQSWKDSFYGSSGITLITCSNPPAPEDLFTYMLERRGGTWHTNAITVRRTLFDRTGLFDEHLRLCQDRAMWMKMAAAGTLLPASVDEPISVRRLHGENRVVLHADTKPMYHMMMLREVASWARRQGLPRQVRQKLIELEISDWERLIAPERRSPRLSQLAFLTGLALRQPAAIRNRGYLRRLGRTLLARPRFSVRKATT